MDAHQALVAAWLELKGITEVHLVTAVIAEGDRTRVEYRDIHGGYSHVYLADSGELEWSHG